MTFFLIFLFVVPNQFFIINIFRDLVLALNIILLITIIIITNKSFLKINCFMVVIYMWTWSLRLFIIYLRFYSFTRIWNPANSVVYSNHFLRDWTLLSSVHWSCSRLWQSMLDLGKRNLRLSIIIKWYLISTFTWMCYEISMYSPINS